MLNSRARVKLISVKFLFNLTVVSGKCPIFAAFFNFFLMKTIYQLCFFDSNAVLLRVSHRVFSDYDEAVAYGHRVLSVDRACYNFTLQVLFLD